MALEERQKIRKILVESNTSQHAAQRLYEYKKGLNKNVSYAYLAQKMGKNSRGYVADLINGKRKISPAVAPLLAQALTLEPAAQELLVAIVEWENAKNENMQNFWKQEIEKLKKLFVFHSPAQSEVKFSDLYFALEVFCAISLFGAACSEQQLAKHFGGVSQNSLRDALGKLSAMGVIAIDDNQISQLKKHINLVSHDKQRDLINFLREGLKETQFLLYKWFLRPKQAFFDSTIISVNRREFEKFLPQLKKEIQKLKVDLEEDEADQLIRFNVQVYPIDHS